MREESFELPVDGGAIRGHRAGSGQPALLLHGGAAVPDYLGGCARRLDGLFETVRYTQRGTPPSDAPPPYTIGSHMADALAVLDLFGIERAWAIGHSWGGAPRPPPARGSSRPDRRRALHRCARGRARRVRDVRGESGSHADG